MGHESKQKSPLLHLAVSGQFADVHNVKFLIDAGVDVNVKDINYGRTALHIVAGDHFYVTSSNVAIAITKMLIDAGADVNAKDKKGLTPLHYVISSANVDLAKTLVNHEVDVNVKDSKGLSLLGYIKAIIRLLPYFMDYAPQTFELFANTFSSLPILLSQSESRDYPHMMGGGVSYGDISVDTSKHKVTLSALLEIQKILMDAGARE